MQMKPDSAAVCPHCGYTADTPVSENVLPVFTILQGKYLVGAPLGKGGFGITYIAMDLQTETIIAIKEYFPTDFACRAADTETVLPINEKQSLYFRTGMKSFTREGELLRRLSDIPGIVQFQDMLYCNNTAYLVMAYIPGISLKKQMKKQGKPFTEREALTMMRPILSALQTMHQKHILHRDISPENLMYAPDHTLTLIDFGAAREFSTDDDENLTVILKRGYAPEEQYHSGSRQGAWTDVYAVCAVLYHMLTGILPQEADKRVESDQLTPLSRLPQISVRPSVCHAIEKGLQVDALERYASVQALMKDLYADPVYDEAKSGSENDAMTSLTTGSVDSGSLPSSSEASQNTAGSFTESTEKPLDSYHEPPTYTNGHASHISSLRVAGYIVLGVFCLFLGSAIMDFVLSGSQSTEKEPSASAAYNASSGLSETVAISYMDSDTSSEATSDATEPQASPDSAVVVEMSGGSVLDYYTSLTEALQVAQQYAGSSLNIRLLKDLTEDICIPAGLEISIDFDNHTLCNVSDHTIINHGDLTLREGTLDNLTNEKAALYNASDGVANLAFMEVTRSAENGIADQEADNLNTYYTIDNQGSLSVYDSTVRNSGSYSSTIHNGTKGAAFTGNFYADVTFTGITTLVEGGYFGLKNEADGCAVIEESATFHNSSDSLIYTKGSLTVNGGVFYNAPCAIKVAGGHYDYTDATFETDKDIENEQGVLPMLDLQHLCPGCMHRWDDPTTDCPRCDYPKDRLTPKDALPVFSILAGKYLIGSPLGKGGFGITYMAMRLTDETIVAIKEFFPNELAIRDVDGETVLPADAAKTVYYRTGMKSFTEEGRILHMLSDVEHIVHVLDMVQANQTSYLVMAYVPGISLKKYMKAQNGPFTEQRALDMIRPILLALSAMHSRHILHRDISPENLMVQPDQTLTLIDFGAARTFSQDDDDNLTVILKRGYAPEEQYHSDSRQGPWSDLYAICAVLYQMLTGIRPQEAAARAKDDQLTPLSQIPGLSLQKTTCTAIEKGLQVDPLERYPDIAAFMKVLYARPVAAAKAADTQTVSAARTAPVASNASTSTDSERIFHDEKKEPEKLFHDVEDPSITPTADDRKTTSEIAKKRRKRRNILCVVAVLCIVYFLFGGGLRWRSRSAFVTAVPKAQSNTSESNTTSSQIVSSETAALISEIELKKAFSDAFQNRDKEQLLDALDQAFEHWRIALDTTTRMDSSDGNDFSPQLVEWCSSLKNLWPQFGFSLSTELDAENPDEEAITREADTIGGLVASIAVSCDFNYIIFDSAKPSLSQLFEAIYADTVSNAHEQEDAELLGMAAVHKVYSAAQTKNINSDSHLSAAVNAETLHSALISFFANYPAGVEALTATIDLSAEPYATDDFFQQLKLYIAARDFSTNLKG